MVKLSSQESKKRRLQYLYNEHQLKLEEYNQLHKSIDSTTKSGYLHAILGDAQTSIFAMQQMNARLREVVSDLHRLDYEIDELQAELNQSNQISSDSTFCNFCGRENDSDASFCKACGRKI